MTSLYGSRIRQVSTDAGYYVPIGNLMGKISAEPLVAGGPLSTAAWATTSKFTSTINAAGTGALLKDMGKTLVSAGRTFRKVQLVHPSTPSTFGVQGDAGTTPNVDYLTGYIELGFEAQGLGSPAPVALFGR